MNTHSIILLAFFCALVASPFLLRRFSRPRTNVYGSFAVGARNFGWFRIGAGLSATFVGGAAVINLAGLGYTFGWYGLADVLPTSLALIGSAWFIVPRIVQRRGISLGGFVKVSDRWINAATGLLSTVVYTLITAAQIKALTQIAQPWFDVPPAVIAGVAVLGVAAYILYSGYSSVTVTDVIQFVVMGTCYFGLVGFTLLTTDGNGLAPAEAASIAPRTMPLDLILLLAAPLLFVPVSQDLHIRVNSAASLRSARVGVFIAGLAYLAFGVISIGVGCTVAEAGVVLSVQDEAVPTYLAARFGTLAIIPTIAVACVVVSTLDSTLFASASSLAYDFWDAIKRRDPADSKDSVHPRIATAIVLGLALFIALQTPRILDLVLAAVVIYVAVLLPMLVGSMINRTPRALGWLALAVLAVVMVVEVLLATRVIPFQLPYRAFVYTLVHAGIVLLLRKAPPAPHETTG